MMQRVSNKFSASPFLRHYRDNSVLQLIMALGAAFVLFHFTINIMRVMEFKEAEILNSVVAYSTLPGLSEFKLKLWSLLTYGIFHMRMIGGHAQMGFWAMFSNMMWLYCFGSVVQMLIGHKHVIPMFFYGIVMGGAMYMLAQFIPAWEVPAGFYVGGAQAGTTGLAVAAVTIAPKYRFYLTPYYSLPIWVVVSIYGVLMLLYSGLAGAPLALILGGGLMGFLYITLLRRGYNLSSWMYHLSDKVDGSVTPKGDAYQRHNYRRNEVLSSSHHTPVVSEEQRVDDILDKINKKGYNSLTKEEKEILLRASKEN